MPVTRETLGVQLRELRLMRGLSQKELATATGIVAPQLSQIETGRYIPGMEAITRILAALDATLEIELNEGRTVDPSGSTQPPARSTPRVSPS